MAEITPEEKLLNLIKQAQGTLKLKKELKIFTKINIVLIGLIIVILAVFLVDFFTSGNTDTELGLDFQEDEADALPGSDSFDIDIDKEVNTPPAADIPVHKKVTVENLNLLGIITGDKDQAIIEDKEKNKTFFLYRGDSFGGFTLFDIKEGGVVLDYKGEKVELNM